MSDINVRRGQAADLEALVPVFAAATADEATNAWIAAAGPMPEGAYIAYLTASLRRHLLTDEVWVAERDGEIEGLSVWMRVAEPGRFHAEAEEIEALAASTPLPSLRRAAAAIRITADGHPEVFPHLYLYSIAVRPEHRGRGAGGAILKARLAAADEEDLPAYLEASTADSARLYGRFGFEATATRLRLPEDGPALIPMWRPVRAS